MTIKWNPNQTDLGMPEDDWYLQKYGWTKISYYPNSPYALDEDGAIITLYRKDADEDSEYVIEVDRPWVEFICRAWTDSTPDMLSVMNQVKVFVELETVNLKNLIGGSFDRFTDEDDVSRRESIKPGISWLKIAQTED